MAIISQESFEKFTEEEKENIRHDYQIALTTGNGKVVHELENLFGKENLQPKPEIKTWRDVEKEHPEHFSHSNAPNPMFIPSAELRDKLLKKTMATYKIATLIELGYGGIVTEEEWLSEEYPKSVIKCTTDITPRLYNDEVYDDIQFVAFHTNKQRNEFMSYPENRTLVEQYYMI